MSCMPYVDTKPPASKSLCLDQSSVLVLLLQLTRLVVGAQDVLSTDALASIEQLIGATVTVGLLDGQSLVRDAAVLQKKCQSNLVF